MGHNLGMRSRVHPKFKTKYRVNNWSEYDRALVQRGNITLWISENAIVSWKPAQLRLKAFWTQGVAVATHRVRNVLKRTSVMCLRDGRQIEKRHSVMCRAARHHENVKDLVVRKDPGPEPRSPSGEANQAHGVEHASHE